MASRRRLALAALGLAALFSAGTYSAPPDDEQVLRDSLRTAADRLVVLQLPDGSWPETPCEAAGAVAGDLARSGRIARGLLAAHRVLGDEKYLQAASRTAETLLPVLETSPRLASVGNLVFLAQHGRAASRPDIVERVARVRAIQLAHRGATEPDAAARELLGRRNRTQWSDGAWKNYLLWHGGEHAELARAVGEIDWAERFVVATARTWRPDADHAWWTYGAARMAEELSRVPGEEARSLARVELAALESRELLPGLPWNETPYDTSVETLETAAALQAMVVANDPAARTRALEGLKVVALKQGTEGGWARRLSLLDRAGDPRGPDWVPPHQQAAHETTEVDAEVVLALAQGLCSSPFPATPRS